MKPAQPVILSLLATLAGCSTSSTPLSSGGQTGDEGTNRVARANGTASQACGSEESELLAGADTVFGVTVEELVRGFEARSVPLFWRDYDSKDAQLRVAPDSGETSLELRVTLDSEPTFEVRLQDFNESAPAPNGLCEQVYYDAPVTLDVTTDDGGFSESWPAWLNIKSPHYAYLNHRVALDEVQGSFQLESEDYAWESGSISFTTFYYDNGTLGSVRPRFTGLRRVGGEPPGNPTQVEESLDVAEWPSVSSCDGRLSPLPSDALLADRTAQEILSVAAEVASNQLETIELDFDVLPPELCASLGLERTEFNATALVSVPSVGFDASLPISVVAEQNTDGELTSITISHHASYELEPTGLFGYEVTDADDYDQLYLALYGRFQAADDGWEGATELLLNGYRLEDSCPANDAGVVDADCEIPEPEFNLNGVPTPPGRRILTIVDPASHTLGSGGAGSGEY